MTNRAHAIGSLVRHKPSDQRMRIEQCDGDSYSCAWRRYDGSRVSAIVPGDQLEPVFSRDDPAGSDHDGWAPVALRTRDLEI